MVERAGSRTPFASAMEKVHAQIDRQRGLALDLVCATKHTLRKMKGLTPAEKQALFSSREKVAAAAEDRRRWASELLLTYTVSYNQLGEEFPGWDLHPGDTGYYPGEGETGREPTHGQPI